MYQKLLKIVVFSLLPMVIASLFQLQAQAAVAKPPVLSAKSAIVMEVSTGKILYSKNSEERKYPASTTKMITLITALEHGNLSDMVTVSENAVEAEGSSLGLVPGERLKLEEILYGLMLESGNDAAVAVAEHISGSVEPFAVLMTEKARLIGATNTNFLNPSGLPNPNHYSTAHDLAKIAAYGYNNPLFAKIVNTRYKSIPSPGKEQVRELYNENKILRLYEGGNGVKTGYTDAAGRCLVSAAKVNNIQLVAVVLDADRMWEDSMSLLDYGFSQVRASFVYNKGDILKTLPVANGTANAVPLVVKEDIVLAVSDNDQDAFQTIIDTPVSVEAPVTAGRKIGQVRILYRDKEYSAVELVAAAEVERKSFFRLLWESVQSLLAFMMQRFT